MSKQYYELKIITQSFVSDVIYQLNYLFKEGTIITELNRSNDTIWLEVSNESDNGILIKFPTLFNRYSKNWVVTRGVITADNLQLLYTYTPDGNPSDRVIMQTLIPFNFSLSDFSFKK